MDGENLEDIYEVTKKRGGTHYVVRIDPLGASRLDFERHGRVDRRLRIGQRESYPASAV